MSEDIHEHFRHYRSAGIALSATLITLSSTLFYWGKQQMAEALKTGSVGRVEVCITQLVFLSLTILVCLSIQFFNYQGFKCLARSYSMQSTKETSDLWFSKEDCAVYIAFGLFIASLMLSALLFT